MRYFALNGTDHRDHAEQDAAIGDYIRWHNQGARPKSGFAINSKIRGLALLENSSTLVRWLTSRVLEVADSAG